MLSFQQYISRPSDERVLEQIARNMVISGSPIDDVFQFLPLPLNEGFFRRLGAAWRAFWNPDQETFTREQVAQHALEQNKAILAQLQMIQEMLRKKGIEDGEIRKMFDKMNKHYAGVVGSVADALESSPDVDAAMAARTGGSGGGDVTLPPDPGGAWDALQKIPAIQRSEALDSWWNGLPPGEKDKILKILDLEGVAVQGRHLRKPLEVARAAGKI